LAKVKSFYNILFYPLVIFWGSFVFTQSDDIGAIIHSIQKQYAPDHRVAVFDISYIQTPREIIVTGEIDNRRAKTDLITTLRKKVSNKVVDKIHLLPDPSLNDHTHGIVAVAVGDVRKRPGTKEELVTQVLMGMQISLLKRNNGFYLIQTTDRYLGWIDTQLVRMMSPSNVKTWNDAPHVIMTALRGIVFTQPDSTSPILCSIVSGCILKRAGKKEGWIEVELLNGRRGYVTDSLVQDLEEWRESCKLTAENLEQTAKSFLNIPYLWGGTSVRGLDCSGFTKTVYRLNGFELNRDADQQAEQGMHIEPGKDFQQLRKGDLIFFGQKRMRNHPEHITHVGMYLTNQMFIHCPGHGQVRMNSLNSTSTLYDKYLEKIFIRARRIIPH
jgi:gamma-D-glutamyl-L-lysine dipeptidyl-peptidase